MIAEWYARHLHDIFGSVALASCRRGMRQISRHFQAVMLDIASIDGKNHNILHCQGILARKLTEPVPMACGR